jgi:hypothetical protein
MSAKHTIADALGIDAASLQPYQSGKHRPALWTDGESYYCAAKRDPGALAALPWRRYRNGVDVWVSDPLAAAKTEPDALTGTRRA